MSVWFVTGASRGFGAEIVKDALACGNQVVATARPLEDIAIPDDKVLPLAPQVTDENEAREAVDSAVRQFGRIDVVVNVQRAVLPVLPKQRSGHVISISSVGGFTGTPGWGMSTDHEDVAHA
ncbi:MAG TPA: SDR family NAD(P)-dependent oxidoreductase [Kribbella sp.]|jgi:NADP-dependent 3-hydroxy acid dehydrogenase YdfG